MTALERYDYCAAEYLCTCARRGLSETTRRNYERTLKLFRAFYAERPQNSAQPDFPDVEAWMDALAAAGTSPATLRQYLTELRQFFTAAAKPYYGAARMDFCPVDPDFYPRVAKKPYDLLLDDAALTKLWKNDPTPSHTKATWPRNYALVCLILGTGLRNKEVLDLTLADVDFLHAEITVQNGKGNKHRVVDAPPIVLTAIELYLNSGIRPAHLPDAAPLFGTTAPHEMGAARTGEKFHRGTSQWLSSLIERHVRAVTGVPDIRSHDLRHLYSRLALNASGNLSELQAALGHSSPETTQRYAGLVLPHRARDSARAVLAARDAAAQQNAARLKQEAPKPLSPAV